MMSVRQAASGTDRGGAGRLLLAGAAGNGPRLPSSSSAIAAWRRTRGLSSRPSTASSMSPRRRPMSASSRSSSTESRWTARCRANLLASRSRNARTPSAEAVDTPAEAAPTSGERLGHDSRLQAAPLGDEHGRVDPRPVLAGGTSGRQPLGLDWHMRAHFSSPVLHRILVNCLLDRNFCYVFLHCSYDVPSRGAVERIASGTRCGDQAGAGAGPR